MSAQAALDAYWRESASWDAERVRWDRQALRTWRWVAAGGWTCAIAAAVALASLAPLKRVDPFVIRVDNSTGIVDVVPQYTGGASPSQLVTRYLLSHYVNVCERFNFQTAESDYQECGAFHTAALNAKWYAQWKRSNPASPLNLYRDGSTVRAEVVSVTFLKEAQGQGLAQVRFVRRLRPAPDAVEQVTHWIAAVEYAYAVPAKDPRLRSLNPLGFRVSAYHTEQEATPEAVVARAGEAVHGIGAASAPGAVP